ncbi:cell division cycle 25 homolog d isoform X1 [Esox lucius]|uniref:cell division cycle 25 homolog d isoform X1 n=1 Tax=Esox lucius TaxID=8010 RepID=UPI0014776576|nr:cell division cycle 25 homolog d isoform X1 [Esox lucius]XP_028978052.2 cell division cycle 25 homolog d isoform X1 [Esox lucius]XP_028978053.2 cell division cycle 25 homolog d isoform X1 [Esox lucius]XP_028978054.2 cell division cycle 25 homolog d isoform X1 [Esox lucius]
MEITKVHWNDISPEGPVWLPVNNETDWTLSPSPDTEQSPLSELSSGLRSLHCQDHAATPCTKLRLTPDLFSPSPPGTTLDSTPDSRPVPLGEETPTKNLLKDSGNRRRKERFLSPGSSPPKMKRLRVKLSTRFRSPAAVQRSDPGVRGKRGPGQSSPPGGGAACVQRGDMELSEVDQALLSVRRVNSRRRPFSPSSLLGSTMENHSLTGDYSKPLVLPVKRVNHQGLHCITSQTVASLLGGQYSGPVEDFLIVDCRYPYEYQGGHIKGAVNLHTRAQIKGALLQVPGLRQVTSTPGDGPLTAGQGSPSEGSSPRKLIVFHCEFSSERGPRLCHYLREQDRALHASLYPLLFYPELYLLEGGYRHFHACYPELCEPRGYVSMRHHDHRDQWRRPQRKTTSRLRKRSPLYKTF